VCDVKTGEYQDGSPCARHTYNYVQYHAKTNSFLSLGSASLYPLAGTGNSFVHAFDLGGRTWRRQASGELGGQEGSSSAYDAKRDVFWLQPAYDRPLASFDPKANSGAGAWRTHGRLNVNIDTMGAIDTVRDLFVVVDWRAHRVFAHDLANPSGGAVAINTTGDKALESSPGGFEWDPVRQQFVGWKDGADVFALRPPAGDWRTGTWTWSRVEPAATNSLVPQGPGPNGTYGRWRYVPALDAFIVVSGVNQPVYLYRLPDSDVEVPAVAPVDSAHLTLSPDPSVVAAGGYATLNWSSASVDSCTASGGWSGPRGPQGSETVGPLAAATDFVLTCQSVTRTVTAVAKVSLLDAPTISLSTEPTAAAEGEEVQIAWSTQNADSCQAQGEWYGPRPFAGRERSRPIMGSVSFALECTGPGGRTTKTVGVKLARQKQGATESQVFGVGAVDLASSMLLLVGGAAWLARRGHDLRSDA
jgi:hypothetical protein